MLLEQNFLQHPPSYSTNQRASKRNTVKVIFVFPIRSWFQVDALVTAYTHTYTATLPHWRFPSFRFHPLIEQNTDNLAAVVGHFVLFFCKYELSFFLILLASLGTYTVTKSEPNKASFWKITLQKRENSHVDTGTFIPALTRFLYNLLCGKSVPVYGQGHFTGLRR
jgi:hypothetical protein